MPAKSESELQPFPPKLGEESFVVAASEAVEDGSASPPSQPWQTLFESALDAMLVINDAGVYVAANPAACALLELTQEALIGRRIADFLLLDTEFEPAWQEFLAIGQLRGEQLMRLESGRVKTVEFAATAHVYPHHHLSVLRDISDRKQAEAERNALSQQLEQWVISSAEKLEITEAELRSQQQRIDSILNSLECVVWSIDPSTLKTIYVNAAAHSVYGLSPEAFLADAGLWFSCLHPDDLPLLMADIEALHHQSKVDREYRIFHADGTQRWVRGQACLVRDKAGNPLRIDGTTVDISDRKQAEFALQDNQATQQAILEAIPDLLMRVNRDGYILNLISGGEITLYGPIAADQRQSVYQNFPQDLADQRMHYVRLALDTGTRQHYEHAIDLNGKLHYEESRVVPLTDAEVLVIVRDITERKRAEATQADLNQKLKLVNAELNRLATVDGLTEIANRRSFDQALDLEWQRARRQQKFLALILCDIDYFKPYNDNYGHLAGDDCLRQVARVLSGVVNRPGDLVARYGGEEFVLLLPDTDLEGGVEVIEKIQAAIAQCHLPHAFSEVSSTLTLSFGLVCHCPSVKEHSPRELIHRADLALYQAKAQGRNGYAVGDSFG
ncbi:diguanylate cyclase domain-containing protein [Nodosilinea sp. PGN35]|uniref:sensor domain-containing diguanylate cyclase n=1 Tax=Nodosilinea sp. PGN35 TaxID=3020489 RepID=UPI0023B290CF|nr:diguanylate cyclase [Nodosilinea sp. TSF1-S3]MDF0369953.1 diguanylate cyclase [Nodosilinea sp. TSF1-S3]